MCCDTGCSCAQSGRVSCVPRPVRAGDRPVSCCPCGCLRCILKCVWCLLCRPRDPTIPVVVGTEVSYRPARLPLLPCLLAVAAVTCDITCNVAVDGRVPTTACVPAGPHAGPRAVRWRGALRGAVQCRARPLLRHLQVGQGVFRVREDRCAVLKCAVHVQYMGGHALRPNPCC